MKVKIMIASLMLLFMGSVISPASAKVREDLCEDELAKCKNDCDENWNADWAKGACYTGCGAGYAACEIAIE
ncbi:hypothetical protein [Fodinibius halophilus]|uniref:Uncharacterized protein n=1 Tax=Fodinibius halophilus TaxID=1736908 RepID=A0A6M1SU74_9BACT|nr:hypothetical protein [Fodinibius halophilus]NGP87508.1 hypothetical protein [Fodinibius halophilus]